MTQQHCDTLLHSAAQVLTCAGGAKRGAGHAGCWGGRGWGCGDRERGELRRSGPTAEIRAGWRAAREFDLAGKVICPGFVEPHTHLVYAGDRLNEFELKIAGAAYLDILAAGGGIVSTMRATRAASEGDLAHAALGRLEALFRGGVTSCEIKTGYGLSIEAELKMLRVIEALAQTHPCDVFLTLLAAHTTPPEFKADPGAYVDLVVDEIIPRAAAWFAAGAVRNHRSPMSCDVFCENHAFTVEQARRVLRAGAQHGMRPKIHVDQFTSLGGVAMALEEGARSCDHLDVTTPGDRTRLAASGAACVVLPGVTFHLGNAQFANARAMIDEGCIVALSTDMNPGSAPILSTALVMAIACRYQRLSPAEAMNACTINAAHALGIGDSAGSIEGRQAGRPAGDKRARLSKHSVSTWSKPGGGL